MYKFVCREKRKNKTLKQSRHPQTIAQKYTKEHFDKQKSTTKR